MSDARNEDMEVVQDDSRGGAGESGSDASDDDSMPPPQSVPGGLSKQDQLDLERAEEQKLRAKYPQMSGRGPTAPVSAGAGGGGHSTFLQKRLAKGQKYFDSGDYQMAKQKTNRSGPGGPGGMGRLAMPVLAQPPTGDTIPTPELVPVRKTSIIQPLHDHSQAMHVASDPAHATPEPGRPMPNPAIAKLTS